MSVRSELQRIYERDGELTPVAILIEATPADSPLHQFFEWDNDIAAHQHRLSRAAELIRSVRITVETAPETTVRVRAYVSVADDERAAYRSTGDALTDDRARDHVMQQLMRDIAALRAKYAALLDFDAALRRITDTAKAA